MNISQWVAVGAVILAALLTCVRASLKQYAASNGAADADGPNCHVKIDIEISGPVVGHLGGMDILDPLRTDDGKLWRFVGRAPTDKSGQIDIARLPIGSLLIPPSMLYEPG